MKSIYLDEWKRIAKDSKIVYYPELFYTNASYPPLWDIYDLNNTVNYHIRNFKILLLYFDLINLPLGHLYTPFSEYSTQLAYRLVANYEFRTLVDYKTIIYSIGKYRDPIDYHEMISSELTKGGFKQTLVLNSEFKSMFDDLAVVERDIIKQNTSMYTETKKFIKQNQFSNEHLTHIESALYAATSGGNYFMHELFAYHLQDPCFNRVHELINTSYFKISEEGNWKTIAYTPMYSERLGRIQRKSTLYDVHAFLYSPEFFLEFLNQYINTSEINFTNIKVSSLAKIMQHPSRRDFIEKYHETLKIISDSIDGCLTNELPENALSILRKIRENRYRKDYFSWLLFGAKTLFNAIDFSIDINEFNDLIKFDLDRKLNLHSLKVFNKSCYNYLRFVESQTKNIVPTI